LSSTYKTMDKVQNKPNSSVQHKPSSESFQVYQCKGCCNYTWLKASQLLPAEFSPAASCSLCCSVCSVLLSVYCLCVCSGLFWPPLIASGEPPRHHPVLPFCYYVFLSSLYRKPWWPILLSESLSQRCMFGAMRWIGTRLVNRYLTMAVFSDFTSPAFRRHVTTS
jgi:hypothetical protein